MTARSPSTLDRLVEVRARDMEDRQRRLADAIRQQEQVEDAIASLDKAVEQETALAAGDFSLAWTLQTYLAGSRAKRADLEALRQILLGKVEEAREALHAAYTDWKAVDTVREQRLDEKRRARARREQAGYDETALVRAARG